MLAHACSRKEHEPQVSGDEIAFSAPVLHTKALINDVGGMMGGFSVYASRYSGSTIDETFMDNLNVASDGTYTGLYFWTPGAGHAFFGVYPYYDSKDDTIDKGISYEMDTEMDPSGKTLKVKQNGNDVIHSVNGTGEDQLVDLLYGAAVYDDPYIPGEGGSNPGKIKFDLKHACAAISFSINNLSAKSITSVTAEGGSGRVMLSGLNTEAKLSYVIEDGQVVADWTEMAVSNEMSLPAISISGTDTWTHGTQRDWYAGLVFPQNFAMLDVAMTFLVTYKTEPVTTDKYTIDLSNIKTEGSEYVYLPGRHYRYKIDITNQDIMCYVNIVPWIEDDTIVLK